MMRYQDLCVSLYTCAFSVKTGAIVMNLANMQAQSPSFSSLMVYKDMAREQQVQAVYSADRSALEAAALLVKSALRGNSAIARPRRFSVAC